MRSAIWSLRNWWKNLLESKPIQAIKNALGKLFRAIELTLYYILWVPAKFVVRYFFWYIYMGIVLFFKYLFLYVLIIPCKYIWKYALKYPINPIINVLKEAYIKVRNLVTKFNKNKVKVNPFYVDDYGNRYETKTKVLLMPLFAILLLFTVAYKIVYFGFWVLSLIYESLSSLVKTIAKLLKQADKFDNIKASVGQNVKEIEDGSRAVLKGLLYLSPMLILMGIFTFWPIINSFRLIMYEGYQLHPIDGGIYDSFNVSNIYKNLMEAITLDGFLTSGAQSRSILFNTILLTALSVSISTLLSLFIAVGLISIKPLRKLFETIYFLPYITNTIALGLVFKYLFSADGGLINQMFSWAGVDKNLAWLSHGATYFRAMSVLVIYSVWSSLAFKIMVLTSSIQGIDKMYYDAAAIDATPKARVFTKITVPLISPMILYLTITSVIGGFKAYTSVVALFGDQGGEDVLGFNLKTMVFFVYEQMDMSSQPGKMSIAAATIIILFAIIMVFTLVQNQISAKRVHY